jgi:hypothetical protein
MSPNAYTLITQALTPHPCPPALQVETLRRCCRVARGALDAVVRAVRPGVTTEAGWVDGIIAFGVWGLGFKDQGAGVYVCGG